jgi:hypothetical protein
VISPAAILALSCAPGMRGDQPPVPFPHPLITEVLYAVPTEGGDANGDGKRHASGDEFVELVNPHDRPIHLAGYVLSDRNVGTSAALRFEFPKMTLRPGEVVVVFNGYAQEWSGPGGTSRIPPPRGNERFAGAYVLTMEVESAAIALANSGDWVLLSDPRGRGVHLVWWGSVEEDLPAALLVEEAPRTSSASVQRESIAGPFRPHRRLGDLPFSPGKFPLDAPPQEPQTEPGR